MNDLQQHFLAESINKLTILQRRLSGGYSEDWRREAFRAVHTIKGTAQTFGLESAARTAHLFEQTLSVKDFSDDNDKNSKNLSETIRRLILALREKDAGEAPRQESGEPQISKDFSETFAGLVRDEYFDQFSEQEKRKALAALSGNQNIFCAEAGFEMTKFAEDYKTLRKILDEKGEVIAALPGKLKDTGKIGFNIYFASAENIEELRKHTERFSARITAKTAVKDLNIDFQNVLSQIAAYGEKLAKKLEKDIEFEIAAGDVSLSNSSVKTVFDALLHLVRNAVDHGIERRGIVSIEAKRAENGISLTVSDNGKGVDLEKVRSVAAAKKLFAENAFLSDEDVLNLIFAAEFSTAENVSDVSGRGVGLDAVKNAVENAGGRIGIKSESGKGARFEIFLPA